MFSRLFKAALWSPAGKGLTSWLLFVMFNCVFVTFPCDISSTYDLDVHENIVEIFVGESPFYFIVKKLGA